MDAGAAIFGKHPEMGDFVAAGLSPTLTALLEGWLAAVLPELRAMWGQDWGAGFDAGTPVRLWIGPGVAGAGGFAGVMMPSRDKVGRRYPLLAGIAGGGVAPPVVDPDQALYDAATAFLKGPVHLGKGGSKALAAALARALPAGAGAGAVALAPDVPGMLWARRTGDDLGRLWTDATAADHARAARTRVYLWIAGSGSGASAMFADHALPGAAVLAWLLSGAPPLPGDDAADRDATVPAEPHAEPVNDPVAETLATGDGSP